MKIHYIFYAALCLLAACTASESQSSQPLPKQTFFRQLYHRYETPDAEFCKHGNSLGEAQMGTIFFTEKGHVIYTVKRVGRDTISCFYGTYAFTDTGITCTLTDEFYYPGRWDASWLVPDPDYAKGKTRKITPISMALQANPSNGIPYAHVYTEEEKHLVDKRLPYGFFLEACEEPAYMEVFSRFYQQVPVLAEL